jgi:hypothetical protein
MTAGAIWECFKRKVKTSGNFPGRVAFEIRERNSS